ncbi:IIS transcription factor [Melia azedarach]|uniref:IIS transcription factor n=1 Tax=Melia azedarach TaxID=155640 RepID=A0ACC1WV20_MELAZ|nr:IIS transcription factor [Melia azedarach]
MTLEDFFPPTKMKEGLTAPSLVEELVSIMQKEKDAGVKNIGDATRQWAAVASVIAATENRDCLDLFIQLDGLWFIDRWLKDAQKFANDTNEGFIEESITAMLRALEKLHIDNERSLSSGIWITVQNLLGHSSSRVQDRARALFESWKEGKVSGEHDHGVKCVGPSYDDDVAVSAIHGKESSRTESTILDVPLPKASFNEENNVTEPVGGEILPLNSECRQPENTEDVQTKSNNNEPCSDIKLDVIDMQDKPPDHVASKLSNSVAENSFMEDKLPVGTVERTCSVETCNSPASKQCCNEEQSNAQKMNELSKDEKQAATKVCVTASASTGTVEARTVSSAADVASDHDIMSAPPLKDNIDANEGDSDVKATVDGDVRTLASEPKSGMDNMEVANNCSTLVFKSSGEDCECHSDAMQNSSGKESMYGKHKDLGTSFSRIKGIGAAEEDKERISSDGVSDLRNDSNLSKSAMAIQSPDAANKRTSDIELEYGIIDALEVARKVAQEVEREVVDYRERSCSSSEKILSGGIGPPESPDSVNEKQDLVNEVPSKEMPAEQNYCAEAYCEVERQLVNSDNVETEPENGIADVESSQVTEAEVNPEKGLCGFDLNQEVCSDDMDRPVNPVNPVNPVSTPVSVVSASRAAAASGLPAAPLQFEGTLGWKGSAATSAFRPASPRRTSDSDKTTLPIGGANSSSKQRQDFLDIDLNVAEAVDEKLADLIPEKQIPVSSSLHSAESSLEMSPKRSERLKLDLNRISDDSDAPATDLRMETRLVPSRNGHRSPSPASSSSSMQPSLRNIDLNDRPYLHNDFSDQVPHHGKSYQNASAFGSPKADDPVISIMGARVEVNRKDFSPQISSLPNGRTLETAMDGNLARSRGVPGLGTSYSHSPGFGYNGFTTAPALSYSSPTYGPGSTIPYMVDTRGAPVVPQIVASAATVPTSYSQAPPFIMSMTSASSGLNFASRPNLDLNSGFATEGGNRDSLGLRQLFMPSQGRSMEEQLRGSSQPSSSSSGVGGKRKEPDSGRESFQLNCRHQQPPWK